ncbi:MAG: hypothetical protein ACOCX1_03250 [Fimbriimonadaceae bacterium]
MTTGPALKPAGPRVRFEAIFEAFKVFALHWQMLTTVGALAVVALFLFALPVLAFWIFGMMNWIIPNFFAMLGMWSIAVFGAAIAYGLVLSIFGSGLINVALLILKGKTPTYRDAWLPFRQRPLAFTGAGVFISVAFFALQFCFFIPALIFEGLMMFTLPLMIERRLGPIEAMKESFRLLRPHIGMATLVALVLGFLAGSGSYLCYVGMFATIPVSLIALAIIYRDFTVPPTPVP